jgi:hypothetical protein
MKSLDLVKASSLVEIFEFSSVYSFLRSLIQVVTSVLKSTRLLSTLISGLLMLCLLPSPLSNFPLSSRISSSLAV